MFYAEPLDVDTVHSQLYHNLSIPYENPFSHRTSLLAPEVGIKRQGIRVISSLPNVLAGPRSGNKAPGDKSDILTVSYGLGF